MESLVEQKLAGRTVTVQAVISAIQQGQSGGALIIGDPGVGKTLLMEQILRGLDGSVRVVRAHASNALSRVPYGTLAPLLTDLSANDVLSSAAVLRGLTARLERRREDGIRDRTSAQAPPLLAIDGGDYLDASSAAIIEHLVAAKKVRVLMAARSGVIMGGDGLTHGLLTRHYLGALNLKEVHELCEQELDGTVTGCSSAALARISGGNPRFLLALLSQARRSGQLAIRNGVWLLSGDSVPFDSELTDLVQSQLAVLPEEVREVLEMIGLAEPLPLSVVFSLGGYDAVDILSDAKLITISGAPEALVRSRDLLHGEVIRQLVPLGRRTRLRQRLVELASVMASPDAQLRDVQWSLDWGVEVSEAELVDAARSAIDSFDPEFAVSAARAVKDPTFVVAARVESAWACYIRGDHLKALELLNGIEKAITDLLTLKRAVLLEIRLRSHSDNPMYNLAQRTEAWTAAFDRIVADNRDAAADADPADFTRRSIGLLVQSVAVDQGHYDNAVALEGTLAQAESAGDDESALLALSILGEWATATGKPETGAELTGRALKLITDNRTRWRIYYEYVLTRHVMALIRSGQWKAITEAHGEYWTTSWRSSVYSGGAIDFTRSFLGSSQVRTQGPDDFQRRRPGSGGVELGELVAAIEGLKSHDLEHFLPLALGIAAYTSAALECRELADEYCAAFAQAQQGGPLQLQLLSRGFAAAAGYLQTGDRAAMQEVVSMATRAQDAGMSATELELRLLLLRNGDLSGNARIVSLAEQMEGPQAALAGAGVRAINEENFSQLLDIADQAREAGYALLVVICLREAYRLAENAGHQIQLRKTRELLAQIQGRPVSPPNPMPTPVLSKRERAVVALAVDGHSNADIADKLFLSVRTVEGHLYKVFGKLGISRREELTRDHLDEP